MRPLYCFKRNNGFYYVQFVDPVTKKLSYARTTHKKDRDSALVTAYKWLEQGIPGKHAEVTPVSQLHSFDAALSQLKQINLTSSETDRLLAVLNAKGHSCAKVGSASLAKVAAAKSVGAVVPVASLVAVPATATAVEPLVVKQAGHALIPFLLDFWDYDNSKYIQGLLAHGTSITRRHCYEMTNRVKSYWEPAFGVTLTIEELADDDIEDFLLIQKTAKRDSQRKDKDGNAIAPEPLSGATINKILNAIRKPLKWAMKKKIISYDPTASLDSFSSKIKERGILEDAEVQSLIALDWKDERARVATLTSMTTGLRAGELLGLRVQDIREKSILVEHGWNAQDGLKGTKNGKSREVILLPYIRTLLLNYAKSSPHGFGPESFVFYSPIYSNQPCDTKKFNEGFYEALRDINISEEERKVRNIVFHSWRHYNATIISDHLDERTAQLLLGHLTASMTKRYADHATKKKLAIASDALDDAFGSAFKFGSGG